MAALAALGSVRVTDFIQAKPASIQQLKRYVVINRIALAVVLTGAIAVACVAVLPKVVVLGAAMASGIATVFLADYCMKAINLRAQLKARVPQVIQPEGIVLPKQSPCELNRKLALLDTAGLPQEITCDLSDYANDEKKLCIASALQNNHYLKFAKDNVELAGDLVVLVLKLLFRGSPVRNYPDALNHQLKNILPEGVQVSYSPPGIPINVYVSYEDRHEVDARRLMQKISDAGFNAIEAF